MSLLCLPAEPHLQIASYLTTISSLTRFSSTHHLLRARLRAHLIKLKALYFVAAFTNSRTAVSLSKTSKILHQILEPPVVIYRGTYFRNQWNHSGLLPSDVRIDNLQLGLLVWACNRTMGGGTGTYHFEEMERDPLSSSISSNARIPLYGGRRA